MDKKAAEAFAAYVDASLTTEPRRFHFAEIAAEGRRRGVLSAEEMGRCQRAAVFPAWLVAALRGSQRPTFSANGRVAEIEAPFGSSGEPVTLVDAGPVRLSVHNFNRLAIASDGLVKALSPPRGRWMASRIAEAAGVPHLPGTTFDGVVEGGSYYSHFLFDVLPKLLLLSRTELASIDNFLFTALHQPFHGEALARLGIDPERCLARNPSGAVFDADRVLWVSPVRRGVQAPPQLYHAVKSLFAPSTTTGPTPKRIYISRSRAPRRRILNEDDLLPILEAHGYTVVHFEDHGIAGAAALLADAEHIIGLHGAGFANIVFAPGGCRVTEIHGPHISAEYRTMAALFGMPYEAFDCGSLEHDFDGDAFRKNGSDVVLPPDALRSLLLR